MTKSRLGKTVSLQVEVVKREESDEDEGQGGSRREAQQDLFLMRLTVS